MCATLIFAAVLLNLTAYPALADESPSTDASYALTQTEEKEYVEYTFPQINTKISVPKSMITFTSSVTSADPNLGRLGASADELRVMFDKNNLYLETMPENLSYEIILGGVKKSDLKSYNDMSEDELNAAFEEYKAKCGEAASDTIYSSYIYKSATNIYFVIDFSTLSEDVTVYSRKYYTVAEDCEISIALQTKMMSAGDTNDGRTYVFNEEAAATAEDIVNRTSYSRMEEHFTDTSMFSELFGYILGIIVTIGVLALILLLLIKTTSKPKKKKY